MLYVALFVKVSMSSTNKVSDNYFNGLYLIVQSEVKEQMWYKLALISFFLIARVPHSHLSSVSQSRVVGEVEVEGERVAKPARGALLINNDSK